MLFYLNFSRNWVSNSRDIFVVVVVVFLVVVVIVDDNDDFVVFAVVLYQKPSIKVWSKSGQ